MANNDALEYLKVDPNRNDPIELFFSLEMLL